MPGGELDPLAPIVARGCWRMREFKSVSTGLTKPKEGCGENGTGADGGGRKAGFGVLRLPKPYRTGLLTKK